MNGTKLTYGEVVADVLSMYRRLFWQLILMEIAVVIPAALIDGIVTLAVVVFLLSGEPLLVPLVLASPILFLAPVIFYQGLVVEAVDQAQWGSGPIAVSRVFGRVFKRSLPLLGAGVLAGFGVLLGLMLLVVPGLYLMTTWAVIAPAVVIEDCGLTKAFGRSAQLVSGNRWTVLAVMAPVLMAGALMQLLALAFVFVPVYFLLAPVNGLAVAVMYFRLKEIKEGQGTMTGPGGQQAA